MNESIIQEFKKDVADNNRQWLKRPHLSIYDKFPNGEGKGVCCCVYYAYLEACRTFRVPKEGSLEGRENLKRKALVNLQDKLIEYLKSGDSKSFNHKAWSDKLIHDFQGCCGNMTYGKAQKIINMSFKYFYCCDDRPSDEMFYPCHMALDQFTLAWYKTISKIHIVKWANISDYELYDSIQTHIRKYLSKQNTYSKYPLIAEFDIWANERSGCEVFDLTQNTTPEEYLEKTNQIKDLISKL